MPIIIKNCVMLYCDRLSQITTLLQVIWQNIAHAKYLVQIGRLLNGAFRYEYVQKRESILHIIHDRDLSFWNRITSATRP